MSRLTITFLLFALPSFAQSNCSLHLRMVLGAKDETNRFLSILGSPSFHPELLLPILLKNHSGNPRLRSVSREILKQEKPENVIQAEDEMSALSLQQLEPILLEFEAKITNLEKYQDRISKRRIHRLASSLSSFPSTIKRIQSLVLENYSFDLLDTNLWALVGFHQHSRTDKYYRQRTWEPFSYSEISREDVVGITPEEFAAVAWIAMEIESPIIRYSLETGEGIRFLIDRVARWFGKNDEQIQFAKKNNLPYCEGPWCLEEGRHTPTFWRIISHLLGFKPPLDNAPDTHDPITFEEPLAIAHLKARENTEWNASSTYLFLAAHSKGTLQRIVLNIMRDEIKHLAILSAADKYLFGNRPWRRRLDLFKEVIRQIGKHKDSRTTAADALKSPVLMAELAAAHLYSEIQMQKWISTLPLSILKRVFETPSNLYEIPNLIPDPIKKSEIESRLEMGKRIRMHLERWPVRERVKALSNEQFVEQNRTLLDTLIEQLGGFESASSPNSLAHHLWIKKVQSLTSRKSGVPFEEMPHLKAALLDQVRHYQIENNAYIRKRREGKVFLGKPLE